MPNWADNRLRIEGIPERIEELRNFMTHEENGVTHPFRFENILPTPQDLVDRSSPNRKDPDEMTAKHGAPDWYEWNRRHWGTKWSLDPDDIVVMDTGSNTAFELSFNTAWSPPDGVVKALSEKFPDLLFKLRSCDPAMNWDYQLTVQGKDPFDVAIFEEVEGQYTNETREFFGHEEWEDEEEEEVNT
ncbi:MAG: hypothetical protein JSS66_05970 [Armatimonadetes bacterium]|nr:hypothetical protein [Armatimonadota bacterium]